VNRIDLDTLDFHERVAARYRALAAAIRPGGSWSMHRVTRIVFN
jgi:hypothetical protein